MAVSDVTRSSSTTANAASTTDRLKFADNLEMFLTMLTTQLKNQDPLSPMDSNEFTSQLVQFANVEQQINANSNLERLIALQQGNRLSTAVGYIGKQVKVETSALPLQDGKADYSYILPQNAVEVNIMITDMNERIIKTEVLHNLAAGEYQRNWDGKDAGGNMMGDGTYRLTITGTAANGSTFTSATATIGRVTGVSNVDDEPTLIINDLEVSPDKIVSINEQK